MAKRQGKASLTRRVSASLPTGRTNAGDHTSLPLRLLGCVQRIAPAAVREVIMPNKCMTQAEDLAAQSAFWRGKQVLVTGHTGFKGSWLSLWLLSMGAEVRGLSDEVPTEPSRSEEHTSELQSLMRISYAVFCL